MRSRLKLLIAATLGIVLVSLATSGPQATAALFENAKKDACKGLALDSSQPGCTSTGSKLSGVLSTGIQLFSLVVGVIAVIMIIIGGLKYITSQGDSTAVASAKNTLLYAVVGLVIVAFAQVIVRFVLNKTK